jgi:hypothetical protein
MLCKLLVQQFQTQKILPIDARANCIGGFPV